ncbi:hypothetical protein V8F06_014784 [Rhypophila decipiens]
MNIRCNSPAHSSPSMYPENGALESTSALTTTSHRMQSTPIAVARMTKSFIRATNGTTTMLMPVSRIMTGTMNNMLFPAPVIMIASIASHCTLRNLACSPYR